MSLRRRGAIALYGTKFIDQVGFSETLLDALSKFDGAICVITAQSLDNIPLQCISPECAIADAVDWLTHILHQALRIEFWGYTN